MRQPISIDQKTFEAYLSGDESALGRIYETLKGEIYLFSYKITKSREDAEDVTINVFTKLWEHRKKIDSPVHLRRWAFSTASNLSITFLRNRKHALELTDDVMGNIVDYESTVASLEQGMVWAAVIEELWNYVNSLQPSYRSVLLMRYCENMSIEEIAFARGINKQTVYNQMMKAKSELLILIRNKHLNDNQAIALMLLFSLLELQHAAV